MLVGWELFWLLLNALFFINNADGLDDNPLPIRMAKVNIDRPYFIIYVWSNRPPAAILDDVYMADPSHPESKRKSSTNTTPHSFFDRSRAAVLANTPLAELVELDNKATAFNRVDEDIAAGESVMAPGAGELDLASARSLWEIVSKSTFQDEDTCYCTAGRHTWSSSG